MAKEFQFKKSETADRHNIPGLRPTKRATVLDRTKYYLRTAFRVINICIEIIVTNVSVSKP